MIQYAVIKGEVLSEQIYGFLDKRRSNDIDILVEKKNVSLFENYLSRCGFKQCNDIGKNNPRSQRIMCMSYSHQIPPYHKEKFGFRLNVDINHDVLWGEYEGGRISMDEFLSDTVDMQIYGVTVKVLSIEKTLVQLVLHHYKEMNSLYHLSQHNTITSSMFSDVFGLIMKNQSALSLECVAYLCDKYTIGAYVYYMLYHTNLIYKNPILNLYVEYLEPYRDEAIMESFGLSPYERKCWHVPFLERLNNPNIPQYVRSKLTDADWYKIEINKSVFQ